MQPSRAVTSSGTPTHCRKRGGLRAAPLASSEASVDPRFRRTGGVGSLRHGFRTKRARCPAYPRVRPGLDSVLERWKREPRVVSVGYGRFVRADRIYALVPLGPEERGEGRRTYVHVDGLSEPLVASRSEKAILADVEAALTEAAGIPRRRRAAKGQET